MSILLTDEVAAEVKKQLAALDTPVQLIFFTQKHACGTCAEQHDLLEALTGLSEQLSLEVHEIDSPAALEYSIARAPATVVRGTEDHGIRFYGLTGGYEFGSLIESILLVSDGRASVEPTVAGLASAIRVPVHLEVMVTLACPYCPKMVHLAHQLAVANEYVRADMIDAAEFPELVNRYAVNGVPLTVINGQRGFEGALPAEQALLGVLKQVDPDAYAQIEAGMREAEGLRKAHEAVDDIVYDVMVVGAGPAGLTAALYAQRKGRQTVLVGKQAGGQINDTSQLENYPGLISVGGSELAEAMRQHVEAYPVAERCHTQVDRIDHEAGLFRITTEDLRIYRSRALIYCAGKRYRRLDVPGEDRFIGHGIAWCATCDAPLYREKRVAVVGGGNSALTAVRDLLRYASEIHLVHMLDSFQADSVLVEEVRQAEADGHVHIHMASQVREFLGTDHLEGIRLATAEGKASQDLAVEGVFLEVGLQPSSKLIADLVKLNEQGEVPVQRDQSTALPGLFAAGDVTDEPDKQVIIAAGSGAKAALAADRYLSSLKTGGGE